MSELKNLKIHCDQHARLVAGAKSSGGTSKGYSIFEFSNALIEHALERFESGAISLRGVSAVEKHHATPDDTLPANTAHTATSKEGAV